MANKTITPGDVEAGIRAALEDVHGHGMTLREISERLRAEGVDVDHNKVHRIITGARTVSLAEAVAISRAFGIELAELSGERIPTARAHADVRDSIERASWEVARIFDRFTEVAYDLLRARHISAERPEIAEWISEQYEAAYNERAAMYKAHFERDARGHASLSAFVLAQRQTAREWVLEAVDSDGAIAMELSEPADKRNR